MNVKWIPCLYYIFYFDKIIASSITPPKRDFITLPGSYGLKASEHFTFRVLQFNVLADGLSALQPNKGGYTRVETSDLMWEKRRQRLISEITQYSPDIITMQEVDHYDDFFFPQLSQMGYCGLFAPKPISACLEVSENSDGCAIFISKKKFHMISSETITLALSKAEVSEEGELNEEDVYIRAQNQV